GAQGVGERLGEGAGGSGVGRVGDEHGHGAHPVRGAAAPPGPRSPGSPPPHRPRPALRTRHAHPFPRYGTVASDIGGTGRRVPLAKHTPPPASPEAPPLSTAALGLSRQRSVAARG